MTAASSPNPEPRKHHRRWTRVVAWIAGSLATLVLLIVIGVIVLLHSARFHHYLLAIAENKASDAIGVPVHIDNFALHLSDLSLDLYGIAIDGAQPYPSPPLLVVPHAEVGVRIVSIWHGKWYLNDVRIDRPVARVFTATNGTSNIPKARNSGGSGTNIFQLGIRHAVLDKGSLYYNDRKIPLAADLHDVNFSSVFHTVGQEYSGSLSYRNGVIQAGAFNSIPSNFQSQFIATPEEFSLTQSRLTSGASQFELTATLKDYSSPRVQAQYRALVEGGEFRRILRNPSIPSGLIRTSGSIEYTYAANVPMLDSVVLNGDLSSRRLDVKTSKARIAINALKAQYSLANGSAQVKNLRAHVLGGELTGTASMRNLTGATKSSLSATLRGVSLAELKRVAPQTLTARQLRLTGTANVNAKASWGKTLHSLVAHLNATLNGHLSKPAHVAAAAEVAAAALPSTTLPVEGVIRATYSAKSGNIALSQSHLRISGTTLTANGAVNSRAGLAIHLTSGNLGDLESIADLVRAPSPNQSPQSLGLAGKASFLGALHGTVANPRLTGQLDVAHLQVRGTSWRVLRAYIVASPSFVGLQNADLESSGSGRITFNASARLAKWSFTKHSAVQIELHASQVNLAQLEKVAGSTFPVAGTLAASIHAHGTLADPAGQGSLKITRANVYSQPIPSANLVFTGADGQADGQLTVHVAGGTLRAVAHVQPVQKTYTAQLTATGIELAQFQALKSHNIDTQGTLSMHADGHGSFANPQFDATLQIPQLAVRQQKIQQIALRMDVANHVATASLNSHAVGTSLQASAKVNLTGDYYSEAMLNTQAIPLQPLLAMYAPSEASELSGHTELHATLRGPLKNKKLLEAHVIVPTLQLNYGSKIHLAAASPIHVNYQNGVLNLERAAIRGTDTNLQIEGSIPTASHAPMSLLVLGTVNLNLAQMFNPDIKSSGELRLNINSYGAPANSNVEGQVEIVNANFTSGSLPIGMQHGNGVLTLTKNRLNVKSFTAAVGGGTVTAQGGVAYRPSIQFDLGATASGIRMLYPLGVREQIGANLRLAGTAENALLAGRVNIENLSFTRDFDLMSLASQLSSGVAPPPSQGFSQNLQLNLAVNSVNSLNAVSRTFSIDGTANLQVRGTAADPVILGRINVSDGDLIFNGNRYTLAGGTVEFVNPAETQPVINLALNTTIQQYNITLRFNGPVDQLRTNYASDPSLPSADIINLLAFGQTTEAAAANPTPGDQAAMSLVASGVSSQLTSRVAKVAGISQLSINPVLAGGSAQGPAGAIITVQQRVTGNLFVTYSTNVSSTQNQIIMGQYRLSPRVSLSVTRDQNGGFGFDTLFKKSW